MPPSEAETLLDRAKRLREETGELPFVLEVKRDGVPLVVMALYDTKAVRASAKSLAHTLRADALGLAIEAWRAETDQIDEAQMVEDVLADRTAGYERGVFAVVVRANGSVSAAGQALKIRDDGTPEWVGEVDASDDEDAVFGDASQALQAALLVRNDALHAEFEALSLRQRAEITLGALAQLGVEGSGQVLVDE